MAAEALKAKMKRCNKRNRRARWAVDEDAAAREIAAKARREEWSIYRATCKLVERLRYCDDPGPGRSWHACRTYLGRHFGVGRSGKNKT